MTDSSGQAAGSVNVRHALAIMQNYRTCEFTTVFRDGTPQTWPVSPSLSAMAGFYCAPASGFPRRCSISDAIPRSAFSFRIPRAADYPLREPY